MLGTDIGGYITPHFALDRSAFGAGVGNPGALTGESWHRTLKRPLHISAQLQLGLDATMASGQSISVFSKLQHSSDGSSWDDFPGASGVSTVTALNSGANQKVAIQALNVNLIGCKEYVRAVVTPTLTASGSSTAEIFGLWAAGGGETIPPTETDA